MIRYIVVIVAAMVLVPIGPQAKAQTKKQPPAAKQAMLAQIKQQLGPFLKGNPTDKSVLNKWLVETRLPGRYLQTLYEWHARCLRNAIFALQGARFQDKHLRAFFAKQKWYKGSRNSRKIRIGNMAQENVKQLLLAEQIIPTFGRMVGRWPLSLSKKNGAYTFTFGNRRRIIQTPKAIEFYDVSLNSQSVRLPPRLRMTIARVDVGGEKLKLRGYFKHYALLHAVGASDMQYIRIYNLHTKKLVFKRDDMSGTATFQLDQNQKHLLYDEELAFPKKCAAKNTTYPARESACWPLLQQKYPGLKSVSAPKCKCQGGLGPFVMGQFRISTGKTLGKPIPTGRIKCGCSS